MLKFDEFYSESFRRTPLDDYEDEEEDSDVSDENPLNGSCD